MSISILTLFTYHFFSGKKVSTLSYADIYHPSLSGELLKFPEQTNHALTAYFHLTHSPLKSLTLPSNQEPLPNLSGLHYFAYPLSRLAFDRSIKHIKGIRHSDFPSYEVDFNSDARERITFYQGPTNQEADILSFLNALATFKISEVRHQLKQHLTLIPFIDPFNGCRVIVRNEQAKSLDGEAFCSGHNGPEKRTFSLFLAGSTLFLIQQVHEDLGVFEDYEFSLENSPPIILSKPHSSGLESTKKAKKSELSPDFFK